MRSQSYWFSNVTPLLEFIPLVLNMAPSAVLLFLVSRVLLVIPIAGIPAIYLNGRSENSLQRAESAVATKRRRRSSKKGAKEQRFRNQVL